MGDRKEVKRWREEWHLFDWSSFQRRILDWCINGTGNLAVEAVAGSGKTFTLVGVLGCIPTSFKAQVLAFNVSIKEKIENDPKVSNQQVKVSTVHSYGLSLIRAYFEGRAPKVEDRKYAKIADELVQDLLRARSDHTSGTKLYPTEPPDLNEVGLDAFAFAVKKLCNFARLSLTPWENEELEKIVNHYNIKFPTTNSLIWGIHLAKKGLQAGLDQALKEKIIDQTDMIFLPCYWNIPARGKKHICLVDEAQDANAAMRGIFRKFQDQGARLVFVGDSFQSIMGFAGADSNSFAHIKAEFDTQELPLSICYRCPTSHLKLAQTLVPSILPKAHASEGTVETIPKPEILKLAQAKDLIICRKKAPLLKVCLELVVAGKPARIRNKDIGASLGALAQKALKEQAFSSFSLVFEDYCDLMYKKLNESKDFDAVDNFEDKAMAVKYCYKSFGIECSTIQQFRGKIDELFEDKDDDSLIMLSTIHGSKGGEADNVFILDSHKLPFSHPEQLSWQAQQELNLLYVALTRAKKNLYFAPDGGSLRDPLGGIYLPEPKHKLDVQSPEYIRQRLEECTSIEQLDDLRNTYSSEALKTASRTLPEIQKQQLKAWVEALNTAKAARANPVNPVQLELSLGVYVGEV